MSLSLQNSRMPQVPPEVRNPELQGSRSLPSLDNLDVSQISMPKMNALNQGSQKLDVGSVDIAQAFLPKQSSQGNAEAAPLLSTVGQQLNDDISKIWREKRSEGGFVKLAKSIGKFILDFFTK